MFPSNFVEIVNDPNENNAEKTSNDLNKLEARNNQINSTAINDNGIAIFS